ncbi:MAG: hypothetical protein J6334_05735 [Kiritimatiellae bacterium]|nr:hypothetical protein [Kiritimatiellia bacterium]
MLTFENAAADMLANLGGITVDYKEEPTVGTVVIGPAYGLAAADIESNVAVTVNGEPYANRFAATVEDDTIKLYFSRGLIMILQ